MSLKQRLRDLLRSRSTPQRRAAYEDVVQRLARTELAERALKAGDRAPPFLLPSADGALVASDDLLASGPLILSFFRGGWCPYCELTMREMQAFLPKITAAGANFVGILPETGGLARHIKHDRGLTFELLVDVDNAVAMQFGIVFRLPDLYRQVLMDQGIDLAQRHGNSAWLLPAGATYVIAPDGIISAAFVDGDYTVRAEPQEIIDALKNVAAR